MKARSRLITVAFVTMLLLALLVLGIAANGGNTVDFYDGEKLVCSVSVAEGDTLSAPAVDEIVVKGGVGYRFLGWTDSKNGDITSVVSASAGSVFYTVREAVEYKVEGTDGSIVWYAPGEATLDALLTGAKAGDLITACSDVSLNGDAMVHCTKSVTVDLNGNTLTVNNSLVPNSKSTIVVCNGTVNVMQKELVQMSEWRSSGCKFELRDVTVKKGEGSLNKGLVDMRVGEITLENVTVNDGEWNIAASGANSFIGVGYKSRELSQSIKITVKGCNITLPAISFISAGGASGETNGYALDIDINSSYIKTATNVIKVSPVSTAIENCSADIAIDGGSYILSTGGFSNQVIFNIDPNMNDEKVVVWADYGVQFTRFPKLAAGTLILGDGDAMLEMIEDDGYGIVADLWVDDYTPVTDYAYSFCVVGDTQMTTDFDPSNLKLLYDWIVANKENKKISYVFGMGDITNHSAKDEWEIAYEEITKLNGVVDYALIRGNHDTSETFNSTFNNEEYKSMFNGFYSEDLIENSYDIFTVGDVKYLHITLDYHVSDAVLSWAGGIIEEYSDHRVIISTHSYLASDGTLDTRGYTYNGVTNSGEQIWDKLASQYENVFLVLSGHVFSTELVYLQSEGKHGNTVTQIMTNGQTLDYRNGAMGLVSMLYFSEDGKTVSVEYYSTVYDRYLGKNSQFTVTVPEYKGTVSAPKDYLYSVTANDGTTVYYDSSYKFSEIMTTYVSHGALVSIHADVSIDSGFRVEKHVSLNLNGYTISTDGGKINGGNINLNVTNGKINITNYEFLYVSEGYASCSLNVSNVEVYHTSAKLDKMFVDTRSGSIVLDNVTVSEGSWSSVTAAFISCGYKTKKQSQPINITIKNSSIDLSGSSSNLVGLTAASNEVNGWEANITVSNTTVTTGGHVVYAKTVSTSAANCKINVLFNNGTVLNTDTTFNISADIPKENVSVTLAAGVKTMGIPYIAGVSTSYSGGVLAYDNESGLCVVLSKSDVDGGKCGCMLVGKDESVYLYYLGTAFTKELVAMAENSECNIVLLTNMTMPAGTSSSSQYTITAKTLTIDLNGNTLFMPSNTRFTTNATTVLTVINGTIEHAYNVFYSYSGDDDVTSFTAKNVKFIATTNNTSFDHRIGFLNLEDCVFEFKVAPTSDKFVFGFGYVNNATNEVKVNLTRCTINATGSARSIFKVYGGRPVTLVATDCTFSVGSAAYIVHATNSYTTKPADSFKFVNCNISKNGEGLVSVASTYTDITIVTENVTLPTCTVNGYTTVTSLISGESSVIEYTDALGHTFSTVIESVPHTADNVGYTLYGCANGCSETHKVDNVCKDAKIKAASINIGDTLALIYYVDICSCANVSDYAMSFTMNGVVTLVTVYEMLDGSYTFAFTDIPPQCMGDNIKAELLLNEAVVDSFDNYSVKANAEYLLDTYKDDEALTTLVNDLLNYGAAAQIYRNYKTDALVTDVDTTVDVKPETTDMTLTASTNNDVKITAAGVWFDYNNRIYVKFTANNGANVTVMVNGVSVDAEMEGNVYVAYTGSIAAAEFGKVYTIELCVDGEVVQTLTYSVNSYVYAKWDSESMQKLVRALYAYGVSAENYVSSKD